MTLGQRISGADRNALHELLISGAEALGVALSDHQQQQLLDYVALLGKWNAVYNLTAIRDPRQMLIQHILDSLSIVPHMGGRRDVNALDVGSGGGLPGIVLAIVLPDWQVTLNDIVHKKSAFQNQVRAELKLANLQVVTGRVEQLRPGTDVARPFEVIVSRAFADMADFVSLARHLLTPDGAIWAMKGIRPDEEISRLPAGAHARQVLRLQVPELDAERHLVEVGIDVAADA
jgi:16S rRNA (guanine527-N7)-methyltransferase